MKKIGVDVSVLASNQRTGIGNYCFNLIDNLLQINKTDKFILFAITPLDSSNADVNYFKKYPNVEIKIIRLPIQVFRRLFLLWQKVNWPPIEYFIGKVDIFHSFNWYFPPQGSGKSIATFYDLTSVLFPKWHKAQTTKMDDLRFQRMAKKADLITTISENSKKNFVEKYGDRRIEVIYPGTSMGDRGNMGDWGYRGEYMLFVGTLEPRKNLINLIKGYVNSKIDAKLVLTGGDGWHNKGIWDLINANQDKIIIKGFVSDQELVNLYKNSLCLVYPSLYEGFGIPVLEAMSLGIPVITSNTSSLPEVGGGAVLYVDPENIEEIAKAIQKIFQDKKLRESLIQKGLIQAKKFSCKKSAEKLLKNYYLLLD